MRGLAKSVVTLLVGIAIGAVAVPALKAQTAASGTYIVAEMHVTDPAGFMEYQRREAAQTLASYHGQVLVARALPDVREGAPADGTVTIYGFATPEDASHWYYALDYSKLLLLRQKSATARVYILDGIH